MGTDGGQTLLRGARGAELLGENVRTLDDRGRLSLPTAFRWAFADGVVLVPSPGPCVALLTLDGYEQIEEGMRVKQQASVSGTRWLPRPSTRSRRTSTWTPGPRLPPWDLKAHAGFDTELVVVGQRDRLELERANHEPGAEERWQALVAHIDAEAV